MKCLVLCTAYKMMNNVPYSLLWINTRLEIVFTTLPMQIFTFSRRSSCFLQLCEKKEIIKIKFYVFHTVHLDIAVLIYLFSIFKSTKYKNMSIDLLHLHLLYFFSLNSVIFQLDTNCIWILRNMLMRYFFFFERWFCPETT